MGEKRFENPQTINLQQILITYLALHKLLADRKKEEEEEEGDEGGEKKPRMVRECVRGVPLILFSKLFYFRETRKNNANELVKIIHCMLEYHRN